MSEYRLEIKRPYRAKGSFGEAVSNLEIGIGPLQIEAVDFDGNRVAIPGGIGHIEVDCIAHVAEFDIEERDGKRFLVRFAATSKA